MRNSENRAVLEFFSNCRLDQLIRFVVDRRCGFIKNQELCFSEKKTSQFKKVKKSSPEKSSRETNQLTLTCAQVSTSFCDFVVESFRKRVSEALEMRELDRAPDFRVRVFSERVEIFS